MKQNKDRLENLFRGTKSDGNCRKYKKYCNKCTKEYIHEIVENCKKDPKKLYFTKNKLSYSSSVISEFTQRQSH